jgi:hypothetical protein
LNIVRPLLVSPQLQTSHFTTLTVAKVPKAEVAALIRSPRPTSRMNSQLLPRAQGCVNKFDHFEAHNRPSTIACLAELPLQGERASQWRLEAHS